MRNSIWNVWFIFGLFFVVIGAGVLLNQWMLHRRCTERTQGVIEQGVFSAREAAMMLTFTVDDEAYRQPFGYSNAMNIGDVVTVVYNPAKINRSNCYILEDVPNLRKMGIICMAAGMVFMMAEYAVQRGWFIETKNIFKR